MRLPDPGTPEHKIYQALGRKLERAFALRYGADDGVDPDDEGPGNSALELIAQACDVPERPTLSGKFATAQELAEDKAIEAKREASRLRQEAAKLLNRADRMDMAREIFWSVSADAAEASDNVGPDVEVSR